MFPSLQDVRNIIVEICVNNGGMAEKDAENYIRHVKKLESAAAAKLAARQVSLTLAEADQKLRRFEVTQDLNDIAIAMFEMLYKRKIYDVKGIVTPMFIVHHSCIIANYRKLASWATSTLQVPETLVNHHLLSAIAALLVGINFLFVQPLKSLKDHWTYP